MTEHRCKKCDRPITTDAALARAVFEGMHWLCFHLEFEHPEDPDVPCGDPTCHVSSNTTTRLVPLTPATLASEADRATSLLRGKVVVQCWRHSPKQVGLLFSDGTRFFVDLQGSGLELSVS